MAITTNAELNTAVANWLARADLTSRIPEFIALCEAKLQRELRARDMQSKNAAFTVNAEYMAVPTDFIEALTFERQTNPRGALKFMPSETMTDTFSASGLPKYYCTVGSQFRFAPTPDGTYQTTLVYLAKIPPLSASNTTNWLLTAHPDAYLYGSLLEASAFMRDDARLTLWKSAYDYAVQGIKAQGDRGRWGGQSMAVRCA